MAKSKKEVIENIKNQMSTFEKEIESLKKQLDVARTFKYKLGEAVQHKTLGSCIIRGLKVTCTREGSIFKGDKVVIKKKYEVITLQGDNLVDEEDVMPLSGAGKYLYNQGDSND